RSTLHEPNLIVAGVVVFLLFGTASAAQVVLHTLITPTARLAGRSLLLLALTLIELGLGLSSIALFLAGTVIGGLGIGLAFMGSLAAINQVAPPEQRAALVSAFFVAAYGGVSSPVIRCHICYRKGENDASDARIWRIWWHYAWGLRHGWGLLGDLLAGGLGYYVARCSTQGYGQYTASPKQYPQQAAIDPSRQR